MSYLQTKHNLADLKSVCEAQHNLKIRSMGLQDKSNVNIHDGRISVSAITLRSETVNSNYVIVSKNTEGEFEWKQLSVADWMDKAPSDILLSSFSNDMDIVLGSEFNSKLDEYLDTIKDTIINSNFSVVSISISNMIVNSEMNTDQACILTNNGKGSNFELAQLENSYLNSNLENSNLVCSAKAVNDLYTFATGIEERLPLLGQTYLTSDQNLIEVTDPLECQKNLGLLDNFQTSNIILQDVSFIEPTAVATTAFQNDNKEYFLKKNRFNQLIFKEDRLINSFLESSFIYPPTADALNALYFDMIDRISVFLQTSNVLSEIVENDELKEIFKNRLIQTGLCNLSFTGNWNDVFNKPTTVSGFCNDLVFLSSYNNLQEISNGHEALRNLGISEVGISGNFADLNLPTAISNIITMDDILGAIEGVPFIRTDLYLEEFSTNPGIARANLGIGDMALFDQFNVEILDGNISVSTCHVVSDFTYKLSNVYLNNAAYSSNYYLRARNVFGQGVWDTFPVADPITGKQGITNLTNTILNNDSTHEAITPHALSNVCYNNDLLVQLLPIAEQNKYGLIKISDDYTTAQTNTVITTTGISNMFSYFTDGNSTFDIALVEQKIELLTTISNLDHQLLEKITEEVSLINSYFQGNSFIEGPGLGIPNEGVLTMIGDRVKTVSSFTPSILQVNETYESYIKEGNLFASSNKQISIGLNLPNDGKTNRFLSTDGSFKDVVFYTLIKTDTGTEQILHNTDVLFSGSLMDFHVDISTISFANPNETMFELLIKQNQLSKELNLTGGLIGDRNNVYTTTDQNYYFKRFEDFYGFGNILDDIPIFTGSENGLVKYNEIVSEQEKQHYYLNALGAWVERSEIMDKAIINTLSITEIMIRDDADNILDLSIINGTCNVEVGMKAAAEYNWTITKDGTNTKFIWKNPFDILIDWSGAEYNTEYQFSTSFISDRGYLNIFTGEPGAKNPRDYYLDGSGRFIKNQNFSTYLTISDYNIQVSQDFNSANSTYGESGFSNTILITYSNVFGMNTHYTNKNEILHVEDTNTGGYLYYQEYYEVDKYNNPSKRYFDLDDSQTSRMLPSINTMVAYVENEASGLSKTNIDDIDFDSQTIVLEKMVIGHSLSNYIRRHIVFDYEINIDNNHSSINSKTYNFYNNMDQFVKAGNVIELYDKIKFEYKYTYGDGAISENYKQTFVTPQSLSNWVYEKIENKFANVGFDANVLISNPNEYEYDNNLLSSKIVIGSTLSNYIRNVLTYQDTAASDTLPTIIASDKLVMRSNLLHYVEKHKYTYISKDNFYQNDFNYITPSNLKRFFDDSGLDGEVLSSITVAFNMSYMQNKNIFDDSTFNSNTLVSLGALSNLLFNRIRYENNDFSTDNDNFVSSSNVALYVKNILTENTFTNYDYTNFKNDDETFVSSSNVATYINDKLESITFDNYSDIHFETENNKFVSSSNVAVYTKELIETYKNETLKNLGFDKTNAELDIPDDYLNDFVTFSNLSTILFDESFGLKFNYDYENRVYIRTDFSNDTISYVSPHDVHMYLDTNIYTFNTFNFIKNDAAFYYVGNEGQKMTTISDVISLVNSNLRYGGDNQANVSYATFSSDEVSMVCPKHVDTYLTNNLYNYSTYTFSGNALLSLSIQDDYNNIITLESLSNILLKELRYTDYNVDSISDEEFVYITPAQTVNYVDYFWETKTYIYNNDTFDSESNQFISPSNVKKYLENNITNIIVNNYTETTAINPELWNDLILNPYGNEHQNKLITLEALSNILFEVESVQNQMKGQVSSEKYNVVDFQIEATETPDSTVPNFMKLYRSVDQGRDLVTGDYYYAADTFESYKDTLSSNHNHKLVTFETHFNAFLDFYEYITFPEVDNNTLHQESDTGDDPYDMSINYTILTDTKYDTCFLTTINLSKFIDRNLLKMTYLEYNFDDYFDVGGNYKIGNLSANIVLPANKQANDHGDSNQIITKNILTHYIDDYFKKWTFDHVVVDYVENDDKYIFPLERYSNVDTGFITSNQYNQLNSIPSLSMVRHICDQVITTFDFESTFSSFNFYLNNGGKNVGIGGEGQVIELTEKGSLTCGSFNSDSNIYMRTYVEHNLSIDTGTDSEENKVKLFQVGCGNTQNSRDNAFEVLENGDVYVKGSIILNDGKWRIKLNEVGDELQLQKGELLVDGGATSYVYTTKHTFL